MHTELEVYKSSMKLVKCVYEMTAGFPRDEIWGLVSQMKRAVISVPSNIAEGCSRKTSKEMLYFLNIAKASLSELTTQIEIAQMLNFIQNQEQCQITIDLAQAVKRQLLGMIKSNEGRAL
ncbi:MAG: four helix bundle protein [Candidatus Cloacimonadaceae bacterium]|nr:four helix bundle protein [Candidatus Cloacimonadaceae bacterium]